MEILAVILSSALISGLVSALINGWFGLRSKQNDYANAYYKLILDRRLDAYEKVETLIRSIKTAVVDDDDRRPYHRLFSDDTNHTHVYEQLDGPMSRALWLSDDMFDATRQLNLLVYGSAIESLGLIEFGKVNYTAIADLRVEMERLLCRDMLRLHDAPAFLKSKVPANSYGALPARN